MIVYFILLGLICAVWFFNIYFKIKAEQARLLFLLTSFLALVLISGLRDFSVGTDTQTYINVFFNKTYWQFELAFALLSFIVRSFTASGTVYLLALAFLMYGLVFKSINLSLGSCLPYNHTARDQNKGIVLFENKKIYFTVFFFVTLGFYFYSFNIIRQFIAMGFSLNAFFYAKEKKLIPFIFMVILGTLFHTSCLVSLVYLCFFFNSLNRKRKFVRIEVKTKTEAVWTRFLIPFLFLTLVLFCFGFIIPRFFNLVVSILFPSYLGYLQSDYMGQVAGVHTFLVSLAILIAYYLFSADDYRDRRINIFVMFCAVTFNSLAFSFALMTRIAWYYQIVECSILTSLLTNNTLKRNKKIVFMIVVFICCIMYYSSLLLFSETSGARNYFFKGF